MRADITLPNNPERLGMAQMRDDLTFVCEGHAQHLTLISPARNEEDTGRARFPLVVFLQGSGWTSPDRFAQLPQLCAYAQQGLAVASIAHRDSTKGHPFPGYLKDAKAAIRYLRSRAKELWLDPERVAFFGTSSGGNTALFAVEDPLSCTRLGRTRDDAAGEAFDKVAKLLDLGYPGGPVISRLAAGGDPAAIAFPRARLGEDSLDFSFSGLKTSVATAVDRLRRSGAPLPKADLCASFQEAVVEVLVDKTLLAVQRTGHRRVVLGGGVAANPRLRAALSQRCAEQGLSLFLPAPVYCTDNAAMIAVAGYHQFLAGHLLEADADAYSRSPLN